MVHKHILIIGVIEGTQTFSKKAHKHILDKDTQHTHVHFSQCLWIPVSLASGLHSAKNPIVNAL